MTPATLPEARIVHEIPGRLRLRISSMAGNALFFSDLGQRLRSCPGVHAVEANDVTGSVLVAHSTTASAILDYCQANSLFFVPPEMPAIALSTRVSGRLERWDERITAATGGQIDLRSAAFLGLASAGALQVLRGKVLPPGLNLLWYALGLVWITGPENHH